MSAAPSPFGPQLYEFLADLAENNRKEWFDAHKGEYELHVKEAALDFISQVAGPLHQLTPHVRAIPKVNGGSLFRIFRDVRFSKDKRPYKDHVGIHFPHGAGKGAHAPGYYLHLMPGNSFVGLGMKGPDSPTLHQVRERIADHTEAWNEAIGGPFADAFHLTGDSLQRAPKGFDPDHPAIEDIKRKDYIAVHDLDDDEVLAAGFVEHYADLCRQGTPLVRFLCDALDLPF